MLERSCSESVASLSLSPWLLGRMLARVAILLLIVLAATATSRTAAAQAPACWAPDELASREGEERVHKGVRQALIAPPRRALADFSPIAPHGLVRRVKLPAGQKLVALTFDLCEQPSEISGYQGAIVDFLRQNGIKATFFLGGKWILSHQERTQQLMSDPRFEIANHSWEHRDFRLLSGSALLDEIKNAQAAYEQVHNELAAKQCTGPDAGRLAHEQAPRR